MELENYELFRLILFTREAIAVYRKIGAETLAKMAEETLRKLEAEKAKREG